MRLAVPATMLTAASMSLAFRSCIFCAATASSCLRVIFPIFSVFGFPDPFLIPSSFFISADVSGVLNSNSNDLSSKT